MKILSIFLFSYALPVFSDLAIDSPNRNNLLTHFDPERHEIAFISQSPEAPTVLSAAVIDRVRVGETNSRILRILSPYVLTSSHDPERRRIHLLLSGDDVFATDEFLYSIDIYDRIHPSGLIDVNGKNYVAYRLKGSENFDSNYWHINMDFENSTIVFDLRNIDAKVKKILKHLYNNATEKIKKEFTTTEIVTAIQQRLNDGYRSRLEQGSAAVVAELLSLGDIASELATNPSWGIERLKANKLARVRVVGSLFGLEVRNRLAKHIATRRSARAIRELNDIYASFRYRQLTARALGIYSLPGCTYTR